MTPATMSPEFIRDTEKENSWHIVLYCNGVSMAFHLKTAQKAPSSWLNSYMFGLSQCISPGCLRPILQSWQKVTNIFDDNIGLPLERCHLFWSPPQSPPFIINHIVGRLVMQSLGAVKHQWSSNCFSIPLKGHIPVSRTVQKQCVASLRPTCSLYLSVFLSSSYLLLS